VDFDQTVPLGAFDHHHTVGVPKVRDQQGTDERAGTFGCDGCRGG
jgi:hypothetical protein